MKSKITVLVMAGIALVSFSSCEIFVRGGGHGRGHGHGDRDYVQPPNNGLQNSFVAPSLLQSPGLLPPNTIAILNTD